MATDVQQKSFLFFLTRRKVRPVNSVHEGSDTATAPEEHRHLGGACIRHPPHFKRQSLRLVRYILHAAVPNTASGLQGEKPLANEKMQFREVGQFGAQLWEKRWLPGFGRASSVKSGSGLPV